MRDPSSMSKGNALAPNRGNSIPCTVGVPDKGRAIEGLVVCNSWDLKSLVLLNGQALGCYEPFPEVSIVSGNKLFVFKANLQCNSNCPYVIKLIEHEYLGCYSR